MEKIKKRRGVMNNASDITKMSDDVSPYSLYGASAMGFPDKISAVRGVMATRHTAQRVVLDQPEFPYIFTGAENNFGERSSWNIKLKEDSELVKVFPKFKDCPMSTTAYIFRGLETGRYTCKVVKAGENLIEKYGFRMDDSIKGNYAEGDVLHKGDIVAQSSSYVNDNYCGGTNLRMLYTPLPDLTEDALVISKSAAKKMEYNTVSIIEVPVNKNAFLLNNYGDENVYKPFPNIGEKIKDNIVCSVRENSYVSSIYEASAHHINDKNYYAEGDCTLFDIDIRTNVDVDNEQYNYYLSQIRDWYTEIYAYISTIVVDETQNDVSLLDIYHQAEKYLNSSKWVTKEFIADTIIHFYVIKHMKIKKGQKVVGRYGNKTVIAKIRDDELMPKTDDGRPIDVLTNGLSIPKRIIAFAAYESSMTFQQERMHQHIVKMHEDGCPRDEIIQLVSDFVSIYNKEQGEDTMMIYKTEPSETYDDIIKNGIFIQVQPLNEICIRDAILEAYEKYPDIMKRYKIYTKLRHRWIEMEDEHAIGYQYTWVLKQEASKANSTVATGRTTQYDLPVKTTQYNKNLRLHSDNPIKCGEYDTYNYHQGVGPRSFAKNATYLRGSQYEPNSILMTQLNNIELDTTKYNKFPQLDNFKNILKLLGSKLAPDVFSYSTIGSVDEIHEVMIGNCRVNISIPDLRYILIMHSYYLQYMEFKNGCVDMREFFDNMDKTNLFDCIEDKEYIHSIYDLFIQLLPTLDQLKQYE